MITEEQIKNLKPGDIIYLNNYPLTFQTSNIHGNVFAHDDVAECGEGCACWFSNKYLSITSAETAPKYDPCRLFKKGDIVRVVEWNGREIARVGMLGKVVSDEYNTKVELSIDGWSNSVYYPACHLELVTPVEDLEPYFVGESENSYDLFRKTSNGNQLRASFWCKHNPTPDLIELSKANAKATAEAECKRLNAEYRKEQK